MNKALNQYQHIIWDWNGTLLDDRWLCVDIMNRMLKKRKLPAITEAKYQQVFNFPVRNYYVEIGFDFEREPYDEVTVEFIADYQNRWLECELQPRAEQVLTHFGKLGFGQSVLSAMHQDLLKCMISHFKIDGNFNSLLGLDDHYADGKIENGRRHLRELKLNPREVLFVGDTLHDFEVAREIGVDCVLLASGHHSRERLAATGRVVLNSVADLPECLLKS